MVDIEPALNELALFTSRVITSEDIEKTVKIEHQDRMVVRWMLYDHIIPLVKPQTMWLEFGVHSGQTINYISRFTQGVVFGFDSFYGLPEAWQPGFEKGYFTMNGNLPEVNSNVVLVKGLFQDTLPHFLNIIPGNIGFVHIDSDIYSSAKFVLDSIKDRIVHETVIVFDELIGYETYREHELKALNEFAQDISGEYDIEVLAHTNYEQAAVLVVDRKQFEREYFNMLFQIP